MTLQMLPTKAVLAIMAALTLFVIAALQRELDLPLPVTLSITLPVVVAGAALAKGVSMMTPFLFPDMVVALCVLLFLLAGGYEVTVGSTG